MRKKIVVNESMLGTRLDSVVAEELSNFSRSQIGKEIKNGTIRVNDMIVKPSYLVRQNDYISISEAAFQKLPILPEEVPLSILYEDDHLLVVNKPYHMIVHPTTSVRDHTLVNALLGMQIPLAPGEDPLRPGIVHRLDVDTTGCLIIAKTQTAWQRLKEDFSYHRVEKHYKAILEGRLSADALRVETGLERDPIQRKKMCVSEKGKNAISIFQTIAMTSDATLVDVTLLTGRTHQIRVHAKYLNHPIVGDLLYGFRRQKVKTNHILLHAHTISFLHPMTRKNMYFIAPFDQGMIADAKKMGFDENQLCVTTE